MSLSVSDSMEASTSSSTAKRKRTTSSASSPASSKQPKTVHSFFTKVAAAARPPEPDDKTRFRWKDNVGSSATCLYGEKGPLPARDDGKIKVAAFDLDGTLIATSSGAVVAKNEDDWKFWSREVEAKLRETAEAGYHIVIFSNQKLNATQLTVYKKKIKLIAAQFEVPFVLYAATAGDIFRKPLPGMWDHFVASYCRGVVPDLQESFFVGDADGFQRSRGKARDSDRKFALNTGLPFLTPEQFFLGQAERTGWVKQGFDASAYLVNDLPLYSPTSTSLVPDLPAGRKEVVIFVGSPASGKTSLYRRYFQPKGYVHINQDTLRDRKKCVKALKEAFESGKSAVIDNTSPTADVRKVYLDVVSQFGATARCFRFMANADLAKHNNVYRALAAPALQGEKQRDLLPKLAFVSFWDRLEEPTLKEGFQEIKKINFVFEGGDEERKVWQRWWEV